MTARTSPSPLRIECGRRLVEQHQPQRDGDGAASPHSKLNPFVAPTAYRIPLGHKIEDRNGERKIVNSQETRGHHRVPHELALSGDKEAIVDHLNLEKTFDRRRPD
jgi:hypothetical protein